MDIRKLKSPYEIIRIDPWLEPYSGEIDLRMNRFLERRAQLVGDAETLTDFANGHLYFGIHRTETGWVVREWLPGADAAYLTGDFNGWSHDLHPMEKKENGVWEILLEGRDALKHGQNIKLWVEKNGGGFERIPACITRTQQDPRTHMLCGQVWDPEPFAWTDGKWQEKKAEAPLIYEAHIGMATQEERGVRGSGAAQDSEAGLQHRAADGHPGASVLRILRIPGDQFLRGQLPVRYAGGSEVSDQSGPRDGPAGAA